MKDKLEIILLYIGFIIICIPLAFMGIDVFED